MSIQRTFRDVAKPRVVELSGTLVGGVLPLSEGTLFRLSADAVTNTITSLSGHEYLINGQEIHIENRHPSNNLTITIGGFSRVIPAGYESILFFDETNTSFHDVQTSYSLKALEDDIATNASAIATEITDRTNEDLTFLKLDGSRVMTGNLDLNFNFLENVSDGEEPGDAVNKSQLDSEIAALQAAISASATALAWRDPIYVITQWDTGVIPLNGEALVDSTFAGGNSRLFEDDDPGDQFTVATFPVDKTAAFLKSGEEPKLMVCRDVLGTKRWYDETEADVGRKLERQIQATDTFIVTHDLLDSPDSQENSAIYHCVPGTPKVMTKIGDLDWSYATGINIATGYTAGAGNETVVVGNSVQQAIQRLDGNIQLEVSERIAYVNAQIAQEVIDRNAAIAAESVILSAEIDADVLASEIAHAATLASTSVNEGASLIGVEDALGIITATTVEGALAENRAAIDILESDVGTLQSDVSTNTTNIGNNTTAISNNATAISTLESNLASNAAGQGASKIGVEDLNGDFTATTVEGVLAELDAKIDNLNLVELERGLHEAASTGATTLNLTTDFVDVLGGGGVTQDLSSATYIKAVVVRDGAVLVGGVGYTLAANTLTFTAAGGGELLLGEVVEVKIVNVT